MLWCVVMCVFVCWLVGFVCVAMRCVGLFVCVFVCVLVWFVLRCSVFFVLCSVACLCVDLFVCFVVVLCCVVLRCFVLFWFV